MITRIASGRAPITILVLASAGLLSMNYAAAQGEARKPPSSVVTVVGSAEDGTVVKLRYQDTNLKTDAGITALYHRIKVAASTVCHQSLPVWASQRDARLRKCLDSAVDGAVVQVGNARLAGVHREDTSLKTGG